MSWRKWLHNLRYVQPKQALLRRLGFGATRLSIFSTRFGYMIAKRVNAYMTGETEREKVAFIIEQVSDGDVFIDIGANYGYISLVAGSRGAQVWAVEPERVNLNKLHLQVALNSWDIRILPVAISDEPGELFIEPKAGRSTVSKKKSSHDSYVVDTVTVDSLVKDEGLDRVDWVKIDVEGHEVHVLRGARSTLKKFKPVVLIDIHKHVVSPEQCLAAVKDLGYVLRSFGGRKDDYILVHEKHPLAKVDL